MKRASDKKSRKQKALERRIEKKNGHLEAHLKSLEHRVTQAPLVGCIPHFRNPEYPTKPTRYDWKYYRPSVKMMAGRVYLEPEHTTLVKYVTGELDKSQQDKDYVVIKPAREPDMFDKAASFARNFTHSVLDYLSNVKEKVNARRRPR